MNSLLEIQDLQVQIQDSGKKLPVLDRVSLQIRPGEIVGLVGESGSGKTMLSLSCLRLLPEPAAKILGGKILFQGRNLLELNHEEMRRLRGNRIAMVFQDPMSALNPFLSIERQLSEVLEIHQGKTRRDARIPCIEALRQVGIAEPEKKIDCFPHQLSGGQRQRVLIAMALLCEPDLLIADEPTTALDVTIQAQILDLIQNLQKKRNLSVLLVSHDLAVVAKMAQRLYVLYAGKVVEAGPTTELLRSPKHPYTAGLIRSLPNLQSKQRLEPIPGQPPNLAELPPGCAFEPRCSWRQTICQEKIPGLQTIHPSRASACFEWEKL